MTEGVFAAKPRKLKGSSKGIDKLNARRRRVLSKQIGKRDKEIKFEKGMLDTYGNTKLDRDRYQGKIDLKKKSKRKLQKKLDTVPKTVAKKLARLFQPGKVFTALGLYELGDTAVEIGLPAFNKNKASEYGLTPEEYRERLINMVMTSEGRKNFSEGAKEGLKQTFSPPQSLKKVRKNTKERELKGSKPQKYINKQGGGKVGRPKGVGCATRGYGKAMKRGK